VCFVLSFNVSEICHLALAVVPFIGMVRWYNYREIGWWWSLSSVNLMLSKLWTMTMKCENVFLEVLLGGFILIFRFNIVYYLFTSLVYVFLVSILLLLAFFFIVLLKIRPNFINFFKNHLQLQEIEIYLLIL